MRLSLGRRPGVTALPVALAALTGTILAAPAAQAQTVGSFYGDASLNLGYSSDPFLFGSGETSSGFAEIVLTPRYVIAEPLGSTSVGGSYRRTEYFSNNDPAEAYSLQASLSRTLNPRTSVSGQVSFSSSIQGERAALTAPDPLNPIPGVEPEPDPFDPDIDPGTGIDPDVSLIGQRVRRNFYNASGNVSTQISELDSLSLGFGVNRSDFGTVLGIDYWSYSGSASYSRTLSDRTRVGAAVSIAKSTYSGFSPNSTSYSPQLTFDTRFSPELTVNASAGVVIIDSEDPTGLRDSSGFAGSLRGCYTLDRQSLCVSAVRDASATGFGETSQRTTIDLNYSLQLGEADTLRIISYYSHIDTEQPGLSGLIPLTNDYYTATASWDRQVGSRLFLGASVSYRATSDGFNGSSADVSGSVSLRYRVGRVR